MTRLLSVRVLVATWRWLADATSGATVLTVIPQLAMVAACLVTLAVLLPLTAVADLLRWADQ